jgi:hypothetical protein
MEVVAYGDQTMRFNNLLGPGEAYDFMRVSFAPTYANSLHYVFHLCADYHVILPPQTMVNAPQRTIWIAQCPQTMLFVELSDDLLYEIGYQIPRTEPMHLLKVALTCKEWGAMLKNEAFCWNYINVTTSLPFWLTSTKVWESSLGSCLQCLKALVWFWIIKPRD